MLQFDQDVGDDAEFLSEVEAVVQGAVEVSKPATVAVVKIDSWFGPKWLGFSHKVMGAFGVVFPGDLVIPPFVPNRVLSERLCAGAGRPSRRSQADHLCTSISQVRRTPGAGCGICTRPLPSSGGLGTPAGQVGEPSWPTCGPPRGMSAGTWGSSAIVGGASGPSAASASRSSVFFDGELPNPGLPPTGHRPAAECQYRRVDTDVVHGSRPVRGALRVRSTRTGRTRRVPDVHHRRCAFLLDSRDD
jgi:hypothetical protein